MVRKKDNPDYKKHRVIDRRGSKTSVYVRKDNEKSWKVKHRYDRHLRAYLPLVMPPSQVEELREGLEEELEEAPISTRTFVDKLMVETKIRSALADGMGLGGALAAELPVDEEEDNEWVVNDYFNASGDQRYDFPCEIHIRYDPNTDSYIVSKAEIRGVNRLRDLGNDLELSLNS